MKEFISVPKKSRIQAVEWDDFNKSMYERRGKVFYKVPFKLEPQRVEFKKEECHVRL